MLTTGVSYTVLTGNSKELKTPQELIEKLKNKGIIFTHGFTEAAAIDYLKRNNNYYKLTAYRKNFQKDSAGKYVGLDFEYLVDRAIIDMLFRKEILSMALDIEHFEKVKLLNALKNKGDDGYKALRSYRASLETGGESNDAELNKLQTEIENNKGSIYCGDMLSHIPLGQEMPVWVFLEVITFGRFLSFLKFCGEYLNDQNLTNDYYTMKKVKSLRNAAGHSNCIFNDLVLRNREDTATMNDTIAKRFAKICPDCCEGNDILDHRGPNILQNDRIKEIVTLFSMHSKILPSPRMKMHYREELEVILERMYKNYECFYKDNAPISNAFNIILKMVLGWY